MIVFMIETMALVTMELVTVGGRKKKVNKDRTKMGASWVQDRYLLFD